MKNSETLSYIVSVRSAWATRCRREGGRKVKKRNRPVWPAYTCRSRQGSVLTGTGPVIAGRCSSVESQSSPYQCFDTGVLVPITDCGKKARFSSRESSKQTQPGR